MAKTGYMVISCDNPSCEVTVEVATDTSDLIPVGWFRVIEARHSISPFDRKKGRNLLQLDFCSLTCVHEWSVPVVVEEKPATETPTKAVRKRAKSKPKPEVTVVNDTENTENGEQANA